MEMPGAAPVGHQTRLPTWIYFTMIAELLGPEQYAELKQSNIPPDSSRAIVVRSPTGSIIGHVFLCCPVHLEGIEVEPMWRCGQVGATLVEKAEGVAKEAGCKKLFAYAKNHIIENYLGRLGYKKQPLTVWSKDLCHHK